MGQRAERGASGPTVEAFPGKNGKIVFDSDRDGNDEIYVMKRDEL